MNIVGRLLANEAIRKMVLMIATDTLQTYAQALTNVIVRKINNFSQPKHLCTVELEN